MSLAFNKTASPFNGLVQMYEKEIGVERGFVSGNTNRLAEFTTDCNLALDDALAIVMSHSGRWQFDDSGHSDYPIIKTNLVSGQQDYTFTTDETSNLILDIYKVLVLPDASATIYEEIRPIDQQETEQFDDDIATETSVTGTPWRYDKTANGIFLDPSPNYNATLGLKILINREASYFTTSDTTKKPGFDGRIHKYFYLKPALEYARRNNLNNERKIKEAVLETESLMADVYGSRERDDKPVLTNEPIIYE